MRERRGREKIGRKRYAPTANNGSGSGTGRVAAGEGFLEKRPPPQANRTRSRSRSRRCSAGNRPERTAARPQDWDRICCTAPRQEEWRCTAKRNQSTNKQAPAPRSGSEDTELMHKRHKDVVCGVNLWPTISLVRWRMLGGGVSTESIYLLCAVRQSGREVLSVCARQTPTPARRATKQR